MKFPENKLLTKKPPSLVEYMTYFEENLKDTCFDIVTESEEFSVIFLERHIPHLLGLRYFKDKNSPNVKMQQKRQLEGTAGYYNMLNGHIEITDLIQSRKGKQWSVYKKRVLSLNVIKHILMYGEYYVVDGNIRGHVNAKYLVRGNVSNTDINLCLELDLRYDRFGKPYCCISNLVNDKQVKKLIEHETDKHITRLNVKRIIQKDLNSPDILLVKQCKIPFFKTTAGVDKKTISAKSFKVLMQKNDLNYIADYDRTVKTYTIYYLAFDKDTSEFVKEISK